MSPVSREATIAMCLAGARPTSLLLVRREDRWFPRGRGGALGQLEGGADQGAANRALFRVVSAAASVGRIGVVRLHHRLRAVRLLRRLIPFAHRQSTRSLERPLHHSTRSAAPGYDSLLVVVCVRWHGRAWD